jgi:hypothetical protein
VSSGHINDLARRQIHSAVRQALRQADAYGVIPTPLGDVGEAIGTTQVVDISQLPEDLVVSKPSALKKLLGAYLYRAETAFVDFSQPEGRARFIQAHELGHRVVPWHAGAYLDDELRLFRQTEELLELEANLAGAHLIFQGSPFFERALEFPLSLKTPILLAQQFKASLHATIRYYIEGHPDPVAGLIAGRFKRVDGTVPIFLALESQSFRKRFDPIAARFPDASLPVDNGTGPLGPLLVEARDTADTASNPVILLDRNRTQQRCTAEAFFNQRCYFVMFAPATRLRHGRRIRVVAS